MNRPWPSSFWAWAQTRTTPAARGTPLCTVLASRDREGINLYLFEFIREIDLDVLFFKNRILAKMLERGGDLERPDCWGRTPVWVEANRFSLFFSPKLVMGEIRGRSTAQFEKENCFYRHDSHILAGEKMEVAAASLSLFSLSLLRNYFFPFFWEIRQGSKLPFVCVQKSPLPLRILFLFAKDEFAKKRYFPFLPSLEPVRIFTPLTGVTLKLSSHRKLK